MDSVTQFALGAAIGEVTLRRESETGSKSFSWGAALLGGAVGTLPDLDVLTAPFLSAPEALASHRGISHSIFLCTLLSPVLAALLHRAYRSRGLSFRRWLLFVAVTLNTHWMLDCFTMYGTQIFQPFSDYPVSIGSIFIVDPVYTLPILLTLLVSLWVNRGGKPLNLRWAGAGLLLSTCYLGFTLCSKYVVYFRLLEAWQSRGAEYRRFITVPTPFNSLLYYAFVDTGTDVWVADGSLFDSRDRVVKWQRIPKNSDLFPGFGEGPAGRTLLWFSRGFYRLQLDEGGPTFIDLRFGRMRGWLTRQDPSGSDYPFRFRLQPSEPRGPYVTFTRPPRGEGSGEFPWEDLRTRIWGGEL